MRALIVPNRDGTVAHGGCTFVLVQVQEMPLSPEAPIREQFTKRLIYARKWPDEST